MATANEAVSWSKAHKNLLALLATVPDPRDPRGRRHDLPVVLGLGLAAVIAGARSFVAIGEWAAHQPLDVLRSVGVSGPVAPVESTIRRIFACVDSDQLDQILGPLMCTRSHTIGARRVIALDGKTVRGARSKTTNEIPGRSNCS